MIWTIKSNTDRSITYDAKIPQTGRLQMGTEINLTLGGISLAFSKNSMGIDFGHLFQDCDVTRRKMAEINYEYYEEHPEENGGLEQREAAFARPLGKILPRLELLNHTLESARAEYEAIVAESLEIASYSEPPESPSYLSFDEFCALACRHPLASLKDTYVEHRTPDRDTIAQGRFAANADEFSRLPSGIYNYLYYSKKSYVSARLCILSPESMLRVIVQSLAMLRFLRQEGYMTRSTSPAFAVAP